MTLSCRSSAPLKLHLNPDLFSCSRGGRATVRHALRVRDPQRPHSPQPAPQQVRHPGPPAEALEVEEKEDGEVQTDLSWCVISFYFLRIRGERRTAVVSVLHRLVCLLPLWPEFCCVSVEVRQTVSDAVRESQKQSSGLCGRRQRSDQSRRRRLKKTFRFRSLFPVCRPHLNNFSP